MLRLKCTTTRSSCHINWTKYNISPPLKKKLEYFFFDVCFFQFVISKKMFALFEVVKSKQKSFLNLNFLPSLSLYSWSFKAPTKIAVLNSMLLGLVAFSLLVSTVLNFKNSFDLKIFCCLLLMFRNCTHLIITADLLFFRFSWS